MLDDQFLAFFWLSKFLYERVKVFDWDKTGRRSIKLRPNLDELVDWVLLNRQLEVIRLTKEGIDDDGHEKIYEHLEDQ